ncbi:MAG: hypothetical protein LBF38_00940 [Deltaproteobacteria bacterium]|nr:hypothetical protein [Deltaproteobacteria bacterium]
MAEEEKVSCPKCQSTQIVIQEKGFSPVKGAIGGLALGNLGLLAGFHGSKNIMLYCLGCGHRWEHKPAGVDPKKKAYEEFKKLMAVSPTAPAPGDWGYSGGLGDYATLANDEVMIKYYENELKDFKPKYLSHWIEVYFGYNLIMAPIFAVILRLVFKLRFLIGLPLCLIVISPLFFYLCRKWGAWREKTELKNQIKDLKESVARRKAAIQSHYTKNK